jgi:hypothetical protein
MSDSLKLVLAAVLAWIGSCPSPEPGGGTAEPAAAVEHVVRPGGNLQDALDAARPGDVITLQANAIFTGPFELRDKQGSGWITIRSSQEGRLPAGQRVSPLHSFLMPRS